MAADKRKKDLKLIEIEKKIAAAKIKYDYTSFLRKNEDIM